MVPRKEVLHVKAFLDDGSIWLMSYSASKTKIVGIWVLLSVWTELCIWLCRKKTAAARSTAGSINHFATCTSEHSGLYGFHHWSLSTWSPGVERMRSTRLRPCCSPQLQFPRGADLSSAIHICPAGCSLMSTMLVEVAALVTWVLLLGLNQVAS